MRLVQERGRLMQEACDREPSTMAAILGVEPDTLREVCARTGAHICNINAPGNITIGGTAAAVEAASAAATEAGASRVVPLTVSGAFHTPLMQSAADGMREVLAKVSFNAPVMPVVSNVTAKPLAEGAVMPEELASSPTARTSRSLTPSRVTSRGNGTPTSVRCSATSATARTSTAS